MKKILTLIIGLSLPFTAFATTAVPWLQTSLTDRFISPANVNGLIQGLLIKASSTLQNFTFTTATGTSATTTNFFAITLFSTTHNNSGLGTFGNFLATGSTTLQNLTFVNATGTAATTTNSFATLGNFTNLCISSDCKTSWPTASLSGGITNALTYWTSPTTIAATSSQPLYVGSVFATTSTASIFTGGYEARASSTLQNFTGVNSTTSQATSTNLFATNFSFTNLISGTVPASKVSAGTFGTGAYTMDTSLTNPLLIGGTGVGSSLSLQSTSGNGSSDFIKFLVGNNGATEAMRILTSGFVGIGTTTPAWKLQITTATAPQLVLSDSNGGTNQKHVAITNEGGELTIASSTDAYATSTTPVLKLKTNGGVQTCGSVLKDQATITVDFSICPYQTVTLAGSRNVTFTATTTYSKVLFEACQDATGSRTITWTGGPIHWQGGTAPTLTTTGSKCDKVMFTTSSTTNYVDAVSSLNY